MDCLYITVIFHILFTVGTKSVHSAHNAIFVGSCPIVESDYVHTNASQETLHCGLNVHLCWKLEIAISDRYTRTYPGSK